MNKKKYGVRFMALLLVALFSINTSVKADSITDGILGVLNDGSLALDAALAGKYDTISDGLYTIENVASGNVLDVYGGTDSSKKDNVQIYPGKLSANQQFNIMLCSEGWYTVYPESQTSKALNPYSDAPKNGTNVNIYKRNTKDKTQCWYFETLGNNTFVIRNAYNTSLVLAATGTDQGSNVRIETYSAGNTKQNWKLTTVGGNDENNGITDGITGAVDSVTDGIKEVVDTVTDGTTGVGDVITGGVTGVVDVIKDVTDNTVTDNKDVSEGGITGGITDAYDLVKETVETLDNVTEVKNGWYVITNKASGKVLDINTRSGNASVYDRGEDWKLNQTFYLQLSSKGWYSVLPKSESTSSLNSFASKPKNGTNVNIYTKNSKDSTQGWYFELVDGGWIIRSAYNKNLVVTATGTKNSSNVRLETYSKGNENQIWRMTAPKGDAPKPLADYKLNIRPYNQTYTGWANTKMGSDDPKAKIGKYGCLVSCLAALETQYQGKKYTPATIVSKLNFTKGNMISSKIWDSYKPTKIDLRNYYDQVNAGNYVLLEIRKGKSTHWLVLYGYAAVTYDANGNPVLKNENFKVADSGWQPNKPDNDEGRYRKLSTYINAGWRITQSKKKS